MRHVTSIVLLLLAFSLVPFTSQSAIPVAEGSSPAWMNAGTMQIGGSASVSFWGRETDDSGYQISINPTFARFVTPNLVLGVSASMTHSSSEYKSNSLTQTSDMSAFGIGPLLTYYFLSCERGAWYVTLQPYLSEVTTKHETEGYLILGGSLDYETTNQARSVDVGLGRAFGLNDHIAITAEAYFSETWEDTSFDVAPHYNYGVRAGFLMFHHSR